MERGSPVSALTRRPSFLTKVMASAPKTPEVLTATGTKRCMGPRSVNEMDVQDCAKQRSEEGVKHF